MKVAYFSMEIGLNESIPTYSGGLGILAGDHIKSAADLNIPLVAVTLLYKRGYFIQNINPFGQQEENLPLLRPARVHGTSSAQGNCKDRRSRRAGGRMEA